jgi:hypothetical protein
MKFFRRTAEYSLLTQKEWRNLGKVESRSSWRETKKIKIKMSTTYKKNEQQQQQQQQQQQGAKNNADL